MEGWEENYCWTCGKFRLIEKYSAKCADCLRKWNVAHTIPYGGIWHKHYDVDGTPMP